MSNSRYRKPELVSDAHIMRDVMKFPSPKRFTDDVSLLILLISLKK